jgi:hypothetical protein
MLKVTKKAIDKIAEYFKDNGIKPVRILRLVDNCLIPIGH